MQVINREVVRLARVPMNELAAVQAHEQAQVDARAARYRARRRYEDTMLQRGAGARTTPSTRKGNHPGAVGAGAHPGTPGTIARPVASSKPTTDPKPGKAQSVTRSQKP